MKLAAKMTAAEKEAFLRRPDVQREKAIITEYIRMLKTEADARYNDGAMPTEEFYCLLRGALGFDHPSMRDERAPRLNIIGPYLLEEIEVICKKPRVVSINGHLVVPQTIPGLNNSNEEFNNSNNGYLTNAMHRLMGGKRRNKRKSSKRTRKNNRR